MIYYLFSKKLDFLSSTPVEDIQLLFPKCLMEKTYNIIKTNSGDFNLIELKDLTLNFNMFVCENCSSTFDVAFFLEKNNLFKEYDVVFSLKQWRGVGQYNRKWESVIGNIHATIKLPIISKFKNFPLPLLISLCLCIYLEKLTLNPMIKWPNDIVVFPSYKKIGGILVKHTNNGTFVGIGINVNSEPKIKDIHMPPSSIKKILGKSFNPIELFIDIVKHMFFCYQELALELDIKNLIEKIEHYLAFINMKVSIISNNKLLNNVKILGISDTGSLKIIYNNQSIVLNSGTIIF